jgi:transcriptional regulator with XRE-family HTH domain
MIERARRMEPLGQALWDQHRSWYWLAKQLGMSRQTLQHYKDGIGTPSDAFFAEAARVLGVRVEQVDGALARTSTAGTRRERRERSA